MDYDFIIIGSGAGGSAAAYKLVRKGKKVLLVEKGKALPSDGSTQDYQKVIVEGIFKSQESWLDKQNKIFAPEEHYNLGGKTKWYGAALLRFDKREFAADIDFQCLGWPLSIEHITPYYDEAESLLGVHTFPIEPDLKIINEKIAQQSAGWYSQGLPLALSDAILEHDYEARHFDGFVSQHGLKADAQTTFLSKVSTNENLHIVTGHAVDRLVGDAADPCKITGIQLDNGQLYTTNTILLAAGAMHSSRLLQDYFMTSGLQTTLPCAKWVGRYFKRHILTALLSFSPSKKTDALRKTTVWLNNHYPHSSIQPLGFSEDVLSSLIPNIVPSGLAKQLGKRAYGFFLQTEDGSHLDNRVISAETSSYPKLDYDILRLPASCKEHQQMISSFSRALWKAGYISFTQSIPLTGTAHACGTLIAGGDPQASVVNSNGKVHGMANLYVTDGSILPRISRVNPALTIYAWGLYVADQLVNKNGDS